MLQVEQRLSLITLGVTDLARAKRFYEDGLGWRPHSSSQESVTFYQLPGMALALWDREELARDAGVANTPPGFGGITLAYNVRSAAEVDRVLQEAQNAGGQVLKAGQPTAWGGFSGYFSDTDGYLWEVAHNPFWAIGDDGSIFLGNASA